MRVPSSESKIAKLKLTSMMLSITNEHEAINKVINSIKSDSHRLLASNERKRETEMNAKIAFTVKTLYSLLMRKLPMMLAIALTRKIYAK